VGYRIVDEQAKAEAVRLVVEQGYSVPQASKLTGIGLTALRRWIADWHRAHSDQRPVPDQARDEYIQALEARLAASEAENEVLKKQLPSHLKLLFPRRR
jgi:transposase